MRAITIRQPWAGCIAIDVTGAKRIENRASGTTYRGPILIHAGSAADVQADTDPRVVALLGRDPRVGQPVGAVIAVADLVDVHTAEDIPTLTGPHGTCCKPWGERLHNGRAARHLVLANVRRLARPVPARGALGLWTPPADLVEHVHRETTWAGAR